MAQYPIPTSGYGTYNNDIFSPPTGSGLTIDEGKKYFVTYPISQPGTQDFSNVDVVGTLTANTTSEFNGDITANTNLILDGTYGTNYIQFPDGSQQFSASVGDGSAFLNAGTSLVPQTFTGYNKFTQQTLFYGSNSTVGSSGIVKVLNSDTTLTATFYQDATGGNDMTLYSSNSFGGLTVRTPASSFTVNPGTINAVANTANFINPINSTYDISTQGVLKVYDGSTFTNNTTIDQQATNLVMSNNSTGGALVFNQVGATNPQVLVIGNNGGILQNALYIRSPSNQALSSSITQGANLVIFNECVSGSNSNIVFQLNNPVSGQPVVQSLVIYSASCNFNVPIYAYQGITLSSGGSTTSILEYVDNTMIRNNNIGGNIQLVTTGTGGVTTNVLNLNSTTQTLATSPTTNNTPTQIATTGYVTTAIQNAITVLDWNFASPGFVTSNGSPDSSVTVTSTLPIENSTFVIGGKNQIFQGADLTWTQNSQIFISYYIVCSAKPCQPYPTGTLQATVTNNTTKTSYPILIAFTNVGGVPGYTYLLNILPTTGVFTSNQDTNSWSLNLSSIPGF